MSNVDSPSQRQPTCVDDVRRVREQLSDQFGNDVHKLGEYVRKIGEDYRQKLGLKTTESDLAAGKSQSG